MPIKIIVLLILGIVIGMTVDSKYLEIFNSSFMILNVELGILEIFLSLIMLIVGIDIGLQKGFFRKIRKMGKGFLVYPIINIIFSLLGGLIGGLIVQYDVIKAIGVASAMGWYTFSTVEFAKISLELSAIAFLTNSLRELLSMIVMPLLGKKFDKMVTISVAGATCMDSNLQIAIKSSNDEMMAVAAIINGLILTFFGAMLVVLFSIIIK